MPTSSPRADFGSFHAPKSVKPSQPPSAPENPKAKAPIRVGDPNGYLRANTMVHSLEPHQPLGRPSGGSAAMTSAGTAVERGMAENRGLISRSVNQLYWVVSGAGALRASV